MSSETNSKFFSSDALLSIYTFCPFDKFCMLVGHYAIDINSLKRRKSLVKRMPETLPSLNALRAFEVSGRHLSFTRAAEELHVSPSAVGHQVASLEKYLNIKLFLRLNRAIELTEEGKAFLPLLQQGFADLHAAVRLLKQRETSSPLVVSVEPTFAAKWLLPRLAGFRDEHPDIKVRIDPDHELAELGVDEVDIALRYGDATENGLEVEWLFSGEEVVVVCSPSLLARGPAVKDPRDLRSYTLIHPSTSYYGLDNEWLAWFQSVGYDRIYQRDKLEVRFSNFAIQAAVEGNGVALASEFLVEHELKTGLLVTPFQTRLYRKFGYYIATHPFRSRDRRVRKFRSWLIGQTKTTSTS